MLILGNLLLFQKLFQESKEQTKTILNVSEYQTWHLVCEQEGFMNFHIYPHFYFLQSLVPSPTLLMFHSYTLILSTNLLKIHFFQSKSCSILFKRTTSPFHWLLPFFLLPHFHLKSTSLLFTWDPFEISSSNIHKPSPPLSVHFSFKLKALSFLIVNCF